MSQPIQLIVRLPYNRPQDTPVPNPPVIEWTPDKEQLFWEVISQSRGREGASIDWPALSAHLQVPLPYLLFRAGKRFEERLRDLQEVKATVSSPDPISNEGAKSEGRPANVLLRRLSNQNPSSGQGRSSPLLSSPKAGSLKLASSGFQSGLHARPPSSSSIVTLPHRGGPILNPAASVRPFPVIPSGSSSSSEEEAEGAEEEEHRQMEKDEASRRIRELDRLVNRDTLPFAPQLRPAMSPPPPRQGRVPASIRTRSEASSSVHGDRSAASASTSPGSAVSGMGMSQQAIQAVARREEVHSSPSPPPLAVQRGRSVLRQTAVERARMNGRDSTAASTSSSFSDISDVSTSALEEAAGSTFRGGTSRLSMFARTHLGRY